MTNLRSISFIFTALITFGGVHADERPNILWISCEDISPNLGCYGDPHAITPNLDRLATEGVRFDRAFTSAGVCAVVRSGVITGMYPPALGSQHMRSRIIPPANVKAFAELLRASGYFTSNRSKTDYQFESTPSIWNRQGNEHNDWRDRTDDDQPFFSVVNITVCHESQIRHGEQKHAKVIAEIGKENKRDPRKVAGTIPDYLPNTPATRKDWAWYHDNITLMDKMAGELLDRLEQDGLAENTLVVFWSDHGMGLPRGKRWIYDSGTHVPVIMRWPEKIKAGSVREDLMTMIDLPPTMLSVAGLEVPRYMQGRVLLGDSAGQEPTYLFFHRDRMDEAFELQRGVRDRRWKYIRNYQLDTPYAQNIDYMNEMPTMQDWRRLFAAGRLASPQKSWFVTPKPVEELYDTEKDRWETSNLAGQKQYADRLERMRDAAEQMQDSLGDLGMIPEAVMMEEMKPDGKSLETQSPAIAVDGGMISLASKTEGASIVFQTRQGGAWSDWKLYTASITPPEDAVQIRAQACRLGYLDSQVVEKAIR